MAADDYRLDMYENIRDMRHEITATHDRKCMRENPPAWPISLSMQSNDHLYFNPSILCQQKKPRSQYIQSMRESPGASSSLLTCIS